MNSKQTGVMALASSFDEITELPKQNIKQKHMSKLKELYKNDTPFAVMQYFENSSIPFFLKFEKGGEKNGLVQVERLFKSQNPIETFNYDYLSDEVAALYQKEKHRK